MSEFLTAVFNNETTVSAGHYTFSSTYSSGEITEGYSLAQTLTGLFYRGGLSKGLANDSIRSNVDATLILKPGDISTAIKENDKITIDSIDYSVIYADNIGEQDEVVIVPLRKFHK